MMSYFLKKLVPYFWLAGLLPGVPSEAQASSDPDQEKVTFYLLRGIGRESGHWGNTFTTYVRAQIPDAQFVLMNLPGAGTYHQERALPTVEKMADFLRAQHKPMIDSLPGKKIIVATSLAGNVALEWITEYPTDFQGAVLLSTSLKGVCQSKHRVQAKAKADFVNIFLIKDLATREKAFLEINSNLNVHNDSLLNAWVAVQTERPVSKGALLKQTMAGMVYQPPHEKPAIPVLVVGSSADKIVHEQCLTQVSEQLDSDLYLHPSAGHGIPVDAPLWLADTMSYWVKQEIVPMPPRTERPGEDPPTRTKDNGLFPVVWLDNGTRSTGKVIARGAKATGKGLTHSWQWLDHGVDWLDRFVKEVGVKDKSQRKGLKQIQKAPLTKPASIVTAGLPKIN